MYVSIGEFGNGANARDLAHHDVDLTGRPEVEHHGDDEPVPEPVQHLHQPAQPAPRIYRAARLNGNRQYLDGRLMGAHFFWRRRG